MSHDKVVNDDHELDVESGEPMNEKIQKDVLSHLQARFVALPPSTVLVPPPKEESRNLLGPHRRRDESWEHYINRRINDAPDADYQARHQKVEEWVKQHSLPEGISQEQYVKQTCEERERMERGLPVGLLMIHGYLWRDVHSSASSFYRDAKGRKFKVDDWDVEGCKDEPYIVQTPYMLHCPRVGHRPDLHPDHCGLSLTDAFIRLGVMTRNDEMVSLGATLGSTKELDSLDSLVGKRVRVACSVEYIREAYYDGDGCYDRVYLVPTGEAFEVDLFGRAAEDWKRQKEMFQGSKAAIVHFDDEMDEFMSGGTKE